MTTCFCKKKKISGHVITDNRVEEPWDAAFVSRSTTGSFTERKLLLFGLCVCHSFPVTNRYGEIDTTIGVQVDMNYVRIVFACLASARPVYVRGCNN